MSFVNYLKYSGASVIMTVNPYHWSWIPIFHFEQDDVWKKAETLRISFLFLTIRIWIDDGSW